MQQKRQREKKAAQPHTITKAVLMQRHEAWKQQHASEYTSPVKRRRRGVHSPSRVSL
jgi:hypothetical protein